MNSFIAIDLELEQPKSDKIPDSRLDEERIIQVGWCVFRCEPEFTVLKTIRKHVNIGVPVSKHIKDLTRIKDEDIEKGTTIGNVYDNLVIDMDKYSSTRVLRQWGGGDMLHLKYEVQRENPEINDDRWQFGRSGLNVKHLYQTYAQANGINWHGGLSTSLVARLGMNWEGQGKHQADVDALNTAKMFSFLYHKLKDK